VTLPRGRPGLTVASLFSSGPIHCWVTVRGRGGGGTASTICSPSSLELFLWLELSLLPTTITTHPLNCHRRHHRPMSCHATAFRCRHHHPMTWWHLYYRIARSALRHSTAATLGWPNRQAGPHGQGICARRLERPVAPNTFRT
jgi:hypothetical protein